MFCLKSCPRCAGDTYEECDQYGRYIACVQCGHYLTEAEEVLLRYVVSYRKAVVRSRVSVPLPSSMRPLD
jgi:hypothetical protein